jgi:5-oxoprolinase (ATP-hydrolysing) subunit A
MVLNEEIVSRFGKHLTRKIDSLCVHGDEPTAVLAARAVRQGLEAAGVEVLPLPAMKLG